MLNGVNVINETLGRSDLVRTGMLWVLAFIFLAFFFGFMMQDTVLPIILFGLLAVFFLWATVAIGKDYQDVKVYTVTVGDNVKFNEFYERYRVIGEDGNIYKIIEREGD